MWFGFSFKKKELSSNKLRLLSQEQWVILWLKKGSNVKENVQAAIHDSFHWAQGQDDSERDGVKTDLWRANKSVRQAGSTWNWSFH